MAYQVAWRRGHVQRFTQPLDDTATGRGPQVYSSRTWRLHSARLLSDDQRIDVPVDYSQKEEIIFQLPVVGLETRVPTRFTKNVCRINSGCVKPSSILFFFFFFPFCECSKSDRVSTTSTSHITVAAWAAPGAMPTSLIRRIPGPPAFSAK
jgi:hypothetical protein